MSNNTTINESIRNIFAKLGITAAPTSSVSEPVQVPAQTKKNAPKREEPKQAETKLPEDYVSCRYSDLLEEIKYFPEGDAPIENNSLYDISDIGKKCYWFCSDKPVGYITAEGKVVTFQHRDSEAIRTMNARLRITPDATLQNAFERYKMSIAKKWAMERDWIPDYRYTQEDNEAEVGMCVMDAIKNGIDRTKITKMCFDRLDDVHKAMKEYKTEVKEEVCNSADRFMYAMLFTGDVNTLHRLENLHGVELPLPTVEDLIQFTENDLEQFKRIKVVFDRTKKKHPAASAECWMSAQSYALNLPTKTAIQFVFGEKSVGKKKYHRCEVAYSREAKQVFTWLLEEIEIMYNEGVAEGLDKWGEILERSRAMSWCNDAYNLIKKYNLMSIESKSDEEENLFSLIVVNPVKMKEILMNVIREAGEKNNCDYFAELNGNVIPEEAGEFIPEEVGDPVPVLASDSDLPF